MALRSYLAIDLKSFYASVECVERGLDPLSVNLVVADVSRTEKTICLAVSPALKEYKIPGRARLFEVVSKVKEVNCARREKISGREFTGESFYSEELKKNPFLAVTYIAAVPRMALYIKYSTDIYQIYLRYAAPEDIHVYSIDEVFIDATDYLETYKMTARELAGRIIKDIRENTGITATAGIGTNLYLAKVAMDIVAKHVEADAFGVRIAELDEISYRKLLWSHRPLTDFWRVGHGYAKKLEEYGLMTMGDIARCSIGSDKELYSEELLYRMFGVNAELLIDHAWGWEPCTIADIRAYRPENESISSGQVLHCGCTAEKALLAVKEMTDILVLELVDKGLMTDQMVLYIGYDSANLKASSGKKYAGEVTSDRYGRSVPKQAHGSADLGGHTSSAKRIMEAVTDLFNRIADPELLVRRVNIAANHLKSETVVNETAEYRQLDLFTDYEAVKKSDEKEKIRLEKEKRMQMAVLDIKKKFGKNAVLRGMSLEEGATAIDRNNQIGGHKA